MADDAKAEIRSAIDAAVPVTDDDRFEGELAPGETGQKGGESPDEGGGPAGPQAWGYDCDEMNEEWAFVLMGSKAVVVREQVTGPIEDRVRVLSLDAFNAKFLNRPTQIRGADGKVKVVTWANRWLRDRRRRSFDGIEFWPNPDGAPGTAGYLNLYRGFSVRPNAKAGSWAVLKDHMLNNVCHGDLKLFTWLFGWFAHMMQRPRERLGTALVMRGRMGTGKTKIGEIMGSLIASHYFLVGDARYITGNFNAHMAACLLLQAEEAVWAGDKAAEGRLKDLITAEIQMIEQKSIDPIRLKNYVRLVMTSNEDWVVPAGKDERRFAVFDVHPRCAQNHAYFAEMDEEMAKGGREALLAELLAFDLTAVNLRQIPRTEGLLEQKFRSLDTVESWWLERLFDGVALRGAEVWPREIQVDKLFDDYLASAEKIGVKRKSEKVVFGIKMAKLVPGAAKVRRFVEESPSAVSRPWHYQLPPLAECRAVFESAVGQPITWGSDDSLPERDDERDRE
jgi:hypothetical protein